jgi:hypothetical protein
VNGWIHDAPPPEWKEGMMLVVENERGGFFFEVIGSCTLVTEWSNHLRDHRDVPGTENDGEGLGIEHWKWIGDAIDDSWGTKIRAWHPGVSAHIHPIDSLPWLHDAEVLP